MSIGLRDDAPEDEGEETVCALGGGGTGVVSLGELKGGKVG